MLILTQILLIIILIPVNLLVYGFANKKIAKDKGKNHKLHFAFGALGALGMIITISSCIKPSLELIGLGVFEVYHIRHFVKYFK